MLQTARETKNYRVAKAGVRSLADDFMRVVVANLKNAAAVGLAAQIDAHTNQPIIANVVVPGIVMLWTRVDAIDSPFEAAYAIASGNVLDNLKKLFVVHQKQQAAKSWIRSQAEFLVGVDVFVNSLAKLTAVNLSLN